MADLFTKVYNPDVLSCIANLSNDEVFTPPDVVIQMLDTLPQELFKNPDTKFLDPACKTGVFLREIAKRLIVGLEPQFPDLQQRIDHIFHNQLYGIAITELTSLLARRGLYCSKYPNSQYSVSQFDTAEGNIRFRRTQHTWKDGKCVYCGAKDVKYDRGNDYESYAYEFIHYLNPQEIFNMKFDVIISNPPYQLNDGGGMGASAVPIYHHFVQQAKKLKPRYLSMIIPSRWFIGGKGLDDFRESMLKDKRITILHDYIDAVNVFTGVEIKGGICYFLWDKEHTGDCEITTHYQNNTESCTRPLLEDGTDIFIRYNKAIAILNKIRSKNEVSFKSIVSNRNPFGFSSAYDKATTEYRVTKYKLYAIKRTVSYLTADTVISKNQQLVDAWKVYVPKAVGSGYMSDKVNPFIGEPNSLCTETYLVIGGFASEQIAKNVCSYIETDFFHFLFGLGKITQNTTSKSYQFVPMQDFSKPWTDEELYKKYNLTQEEIDFIESMIRPME